MPIDPDRISLDIETIAGFNESTSDIGHHRPTFSKAWRAARDYVIAQAEAAGCKVRIDAAGNVHARHASIPWDEKIWLSGSHIDSVPTGGKYDGVIGVIVPLEILRAAHTDGRALPLELVVFAEEEGTTFGIGMIGSRLWANRDEPFAGIGDEAYFDQFRNRDGQTYFEAGAAHGVRRDDLFAERLNPAAYRGMIEVHAEQGPAMWSDGVPLAVVTAIAGRIQYKAKFMGTPNHAGSTPMQFRADPLVAAARVIVGVNDLAHKHGARMVATVGRIDCQPNAVNVIPGVVGFTVDARSPSAETLDAFHRELQQLVITSSSTAFNFMTADEQPPVQMNPNVCAALKRAGGVLPETVSGALHDAAILAPLLPTAMLFVASRDGISHNPAEFSRIEDITVAAHVLGKLVAES